MAEQSIHEMNVGNQLALDALKRIGSSITGGIRQLNQPPAATVPNTYSLGQPSVQSAVLPRGRGSAIVQQPGVTKADVAITPNLPPSTPQPTRTELPGGITREDAPTGLRTFTQGTAGQDGYARMVVTPSQQGLRTAGTVQTPGGMTFSGTAADAQKFMEPVGRVDYNSPQYQDFVAQNREKVTAPAALTTPTASIAIPAKPVFGGTGGWKTDLAKYQADTQAYNAAVGEQGALARESIRAAAGRQPAPESQSQVGLRTMQTKEAEARAGLIGEQTKAAAEQQKWTTLTEEVPTVDPATGLTVMRKQQYLFNQKTKEIARPGEAVGTGTTQDATAKRATFEAAHITTDARRKQWNALTPEQKDALIAQEQTSKVK